MRTDGKQLEALVSFVEARLLSEGFEVKTNTRAYDPDGAQIAEFDIEIRGTVGSTTFAWLIECRDRPSQGKAPNSWIEQLVSRRSRFRFDKVTAVSTTGFAPGVGEYAKSQGIELREVNALSPEQFKDWLAIGKIPHIEMVRELTHASLFMATEESEERTASLAGVITNLTPNAKFLVRSNTREAISLGDAFSGVVDSMGTLFDDLLPNGPEKKVELHATYRINDHYIVITGAGEIRIGKITFLGALRIRETLVPLAVAEEYRHAETGHLISQFAAFAPHVIHGAKYSVEMHKIAETGGTHVLLRKWKGDVQDH